MVFVGEAELDEQALREFIKQHLAAYKAPKHIVVTDVPLRAPNGRADYKGATETAKTALGLSRGLHDE